MKRLMRRQAEALDSMITGVGLRDLATKRKVTVLPQGKLTFQTPTGCRRTSPGPPPRTEQALCRGSPAVRCAASNIGSRVAELSYSSDDEDGGVERGEDRVGRGQEGAEEVVVQHPDVLPHAAVQIPRNDIHHKIIS